MPSCDRSATQSHKTWQEKASCCSSCQVHSTATQQRIPLHSMTLARWRSSRSSWVQPGLMIGAIIGSLLRSRPAWSMKNLCRWNSIRHIAYTMMAWAQCVFVFGSKKNNNNTHNNNTTTIPVAIFAPAIFAQAISAETMLAQVILLNEQDFPSFGIAQPPCKFICQERYRPPIVLGRTM